MGSCTRPRARATVLLRRSTSAWSFAPAAANSGDHPLRSEHEADTASSGSADSQALAEAHQRAERLDCLFTLRRLYRALAAARSALSRGPNPISLPAEPEQYEGTWEEWLANVREQVVFMESLQSTAVKVEALVSSLEGGRLVSIFGEQDCTNAESSVRSVADSTFEQVAARIGEHVACLQYSSVEEAREALDGALRSAQSSPDAATAAAGGLTAWGLERVGPEVKRAEETIEKGLDQLRKRPVSSLGQVASATRGLWARLNGNMSTARAGVPPELSTTVAAGRNGALEPPDPFEAIRANKRQQSEWVADISLQLESLEKELNEASKQREGTLRKQNALDRAKAQQELAGMDARVNCARRALAVRALQREMARIYSSLEEEAADASESSSFREEDVALLVAEFCQLDKSLAKVQQLVDQKREAEVDDQQLAQLATDIPELKNRAGIGATKDPAAPQQAIELSLEMSVRRVRSYAEESFGKAKDAAAFLLRGIKLLGADITSSLRLFWRALRGSSLNRREVTSLRRTSRDLLTFVPFIAVLVTPLTPVGHVLVFSFLQRYFPGLFPSQFTDRRQQLMRRYEELREQLKQAEEAAERNAQERAYKRAAAAVEGMMMEPSVSSSASMEVEGSGPTHKAESRGEDFPADDASEAGESAANKSHIPRQNRMSEMTSSLWDAANSSWTSLAGWQQGSQEGDSVHEAANDQSDNRSRIHGHDGTKWRTRNNVVMDGQLSIDSEEEEEVTRLRIEAEKAAQQVVDTVGEDDGSDAAYEGKSAGSVANAFGTSASDPSKGAKQE